MSALRHEKLSPAEHPSRPRLEVIEGHLESLLRTDRSFAEVFDAVAAAVVWAFFAALFVLFAVAFSAAIWLAVQG